MTTMAAVHENIARAGHKTTAILFVAQSLISAGVIATATVLSILGEQLSGSATWAGVPSATVQMAAAPFAYVWGVAWDRIGRRNGLAVGLVVGLVGMVVGVAAIQTGSMWFFLLGLVGLGGSRAAIQLARSSPRRSTRRYREGERSRTSYWGARSARWEGRCWWRRAAGGHWLLGCPRRRVRSQLPWCCSGLLWPSHGWDCGRSPCK